MRRRCLCALYNEVFKYNRSGPRMCIAFIEVSHYITYIIAVVPMDYDYAVYRAIALTGGYIIIWVKV